MATHKAERCVVLQRPQARGGARAPGATSTGATSWRARAPAECVPRRGDRSALHPLHVGHHGHPEGRGARQRRPRRRAQVEHAATSTAWARARCSGRPRTSAGSSATPTSSTRRCSTGCTTILYEGKPVGTPDAGAFWRVVRAARRERAVHRAHRVPRDQEGGPERRAHRPLRPLALPHAVPRRRALRSRHAPVGARAARRAGDRPLVADRDRLADRRELRRARACCRSSRARRPRRCRATTCACSARTTARCRRGQIGSDRDQAAAAAGLPADALEQRRRLREVVPDAGIPATT